MPAYTLYYFNSRGRAEICRMLFAAANVHYNDRRIDYSEWSSFKSKISGSVLPVLEIDGKTQIPQSMAIARYLAREFGFHGRNNLEMARIDFISDCFYEIVDDYLRLFHDKEGRIMYDQMSDMRTLYIDMDGRMALDPVSGYPVHSRSVGGYPDLSRGDERYPIHIRGDERHHIHTRGDERYHIHTRGDERYPIHTRDDERYPSHTRGEEMYPIHTRDDERYPIHTRDDERYPIHTRDDERYPIEIRGDEKYLIQNRGDDGYPVQTGIDIETGMDYDLSSGLCTNINRGDMVSDINPGLYSEGHTDGHRHVHDHCPLGDSHRVDDPCHIGDSHRVDDPCHIGESHRVDDPCHIGDSHRVDDPCHIGDSHRVDDPCHIGESHRVDDPCHIGESHRVHDPCHIGESHRAHDPCHIGESHRVDDPCCTEDPCHLDDHCRTDDPCDIHSDSYRCDIPSDPSVDRQSMDIAFVEGRMLVMKLLELIQERNDKESGVRFLQRSEMRLRYLETCRRVLPFMERTLEMQHGGNNFFCGDKMMLCDMMCYCALENPLMENATFISNYPKLMALRERVASHLNISQYIQKRYPSDF